MREGGDCQYGDSTQRGPTKCETDNSLKRRVNGGGEILHGKELPGLRGRKTTFNPFGHGDAARRRG